MSNCYLTSQRNGVKRIDPKTSTVADIHRQMALTSINYDSGISEFDKSGLTPLESVVVRPFRVKESPVQMECIVKDIISLGDHGGAGNLVFCEVLLMHIDENILDEEDKIDPHKIGKRNYSGCRCAPGKRAPEQSTYRQ